MRYLSFDIKNYRAISALTVKLDAKLIPLVGINECGKTTILQAIYSFDYINDEEYEGRHLKSTQNLYETVDAEASVSARISLKAKDVIKALDEVSAEISAGELELQEDESPFEYNADEIQKLLGGAEKDLEIEIKRNLNDKLYSTTWNINNLLNSRVINHQFSKNLVIRLPYILYNDDFADRPPSEVSIPATRPKALSGWLAIYERLLEQTDSNYSLFSLVSEPDIRRRDSILSDVETQLNNTLSAGWKNFSTEKKTIVNVSLTISGGEERKLRIQIVEQLDNGKRRHFEILDRSKGFVWYFNFIMKTQFNPKIAGKAEDTVFLLDEPGSYLHSSAQDKLAEKLKEISQKFGIVIYCTHSHHLLNPDFIPLRNIHIVEKSKSKKITLQTFDRYRSKTEKINALQPVYEALQLPFAELFSDSSVLLLVEGINDKYFIETFINLPKGLRILPGTSADSIVKNILYPQTYDKKIFCLWDNDDEGILNQKKARKQYTIDDGLLLLLPLEGRKERRMEEMLTEQDYSTLRNELSLDSSANYDRIIPILFFTEKKKRTKIVEAMTDTTKESLRILGKMLNGAVSGLEK